MIIPIGDEGPGKKIFPVVSISVIVANVLIMLLTGIEAAAGESGIVDAFALVPAELLADPQRHWYKLATTTFLHAGVLHLAGNVLFLWIFADNVEKALGRINFLLFYLGAGVFASAVHVAMHVSSTTMVVGASGAVSGVLGMYLIFFPWNKVRIFVFLIITVRIWKLDAIYFLLIWFGLQILYALVLPGGFVAYWAHTGGFIFGVFVAYVIVLNRYSKRRNR